jgi:hypothetical protein
MISQSDFAIALRVLGIFAHCEDGGHPACRSCELTSIQCQQVTQLVEYESEVVKDGDTGKS